MSLPSPSLDDRTFQDLVDEAKRRIPQLAPEWTDHNVSDPGVALIELFAWMTESLLYRLNQVPDRLYLKFLELMGITLYPPSAARTNLTFRLSAPQEDVIVVPAGTEVATLQTANTSATVFHTVRALEMGPPRLIAALTGTGGTVHAYSDRLEDLRFERTGLTVFPTLQPGDATYFGFERTLRDCILRLDLGATADGVGVRPEDPPVVWEVSSNDTWIPAEVLEDSTGGLNRGGTVELQIPDDHDAVTLHNRRAFWVRLRLLAPREGQPTYRRSPELRTFEATTVGGAVPAMHGERVGHEVLGISDGRPAQAFAVQFVPVLPRDPGQTVVVRTVEGVEERWTEIEDFGRSGPEDRHFIWDSTTGEIRFGPRIRQPDGSERQHGAVPPERAEVSVTGYVFGGGREGNVAPNQLTVLRSAIPFVDTVTNRRAATGGVDGETVEQVKQRGPASIRSGQRAVTAADYELLAYEASRQVGRARALPPAEPGGPIRLLLVPGATVSGARTALEDLRIADHLFTDVSQVIERHRLLGVSVEVGPPRYLGVSVVARVEVQPGRDAELTRQRALEVLYRDLDPVTGGPDGKGWPWDRPLTVPHVYALLTAVDGVSRVLDVLLFEADETTGERAPQGLQFLPLEPDALWFPVRHMVL
ncbi:MAG: putative baseplate assembly protein [Chloroflexota bacterium]